MTDLTEQSLEDVLEELKKLKDESGNKLSIRCTKLMLFPYYDETQEEFINRASNMKKLLGEKQNEPTSKNHSN